MMIDVTLVAATEKDAATLRQLSELYAYDFSEIVDLELGEDGRFGHDFLEPRAFESSRRAYLIRDAGKLAGFAIAARGSRLTGDRETNDVAEFFVVRGHRRRGVGEAAAIALFETQRGLWEVRQTTANVGARTFWRSVIARYTSNEFDETTIDDDRWRGTVQRFSNVA